MIGSDSEEEVKVTVKTMKNNKAVEPDAVSMEMWKILENISIGWFKNLFNTVIIKGKMPENCKKSFTVTICKGNRGMQNCENFGVLQYI